MLVPMFFTNCQSKHKIYLNGYLRFGEGDILRFQHRITSHVTLKFTNFCILCLGSLKSMMQRYIFLTNVLNSLPFDYNEGWFSQFTQVLKHPTKHKSKKGREEEVCQGF